MQKMDIEYMKEKRNHDEVKFSYAYLNAIHTLNKFSVGNGYFVFRFLSLIILNFSFM